MAFYDINSFMSIPITDSSSLHDMIEKDIKDEPHFCGEKQMDDQSEWFHTNSTQAESATDTTTSTRGNTDPNLLVNPQTGLPVGMTTSDLGNPIRTTVLVATTANQSSKSLESSSSRSTFYDSALSSRSTFYDTASARIKIEVIAEAVEQRSPEDVAMSLSPTPDSPIIEPSEKVFPKPAYSYSCLIAMALKNSETGALPVSEIYSFMTENFPYFKTARDGWKNSVRHNLSLNKCFEKIDNPKASGCSRKGLCLVYFPGCLWGLNPKKIEKMEDEISKWRKKDSEAIRRSMANPDILDILEKGHLLSLSPRHPNNILNANSSTTFKAKLSRSVYPPSPVSVNHVSSKGAATSLADAQFLLDDTGDVNIDDVDDNVLADLALQSGLWDDLTAINDFALTNNPSASHITMATMCKSTPIFQSNSLGSSMKNAQLTRLLCKGASPISLNTTGNSQHRPPLST